MIANLPQTEPACSGEDPSICARCAMVSGTCCQTDPANTAKCFPLSEAERARLAPHAASLGVPDAETEDNSREFLDILKVLFPGQKRAIARAFPEDGTHLRLPLDSGGKCLFLQDDGCALPRDTRPWYCQLFPIWVRSGYFDRFQPESCLLTREARGLRELFAALGMTREKAQTVYISLCHDWGMENDDKA